MNKNIPTDLTAKLVAMHESDDVAKHFFDWVSERSRGAYETKVRVASRKTGESYSETVRLFRAFDELSIGRFIQGRKGHESRIEWYYDIIRIGQVAKGEQEELVPNETRPSEDADYEDEIEHSFKLRSDIDVKLTLPADLTASEAKRLSLWIQSLPFDQE